MDNLKPNEKPAHGVTGFILRGVDGELFFRVYDEHDRKKYKDYDIFHHDLEVTVIDNYSSFYHYDEEQKEKEGMDGYIDYPSRLLKGKADVLRKKGEAEDSEGEKP